MNGTETKKLIIDIKDVLKWKTCEAGGVSIFPENIEFFEEVLGNKTHKNTKSVLNLEKITEEEAIILKEHLDYLIMIKE